MNPELTSTDRAVDRWARARLLGRVAEAIQPSLRRWLEADDRRVRALKNVLRGTFLGHVLHPMLTDIPLGAWTVTAVCDALDIVGSPAHRDAADAALAVGIAGAFAAAVTGLADWSDTKDEPQRLGVLHGAINGGALVCYLLSLAGRRCGRRRLGIGLAFAGFTAVVVAAYLGGELSFGMQLGVKHTVIPAELDDFTDLLDEGEVPEGAMRAAEAAGVPVLVSRSEGTFHAVSAVCTHRGAPLADGTREGGCVRCPWHGSRFDLADGRVVEGPATFPLAVFETRTADHIVSARARRAG